MLQNDKERAGTVPRVRAEEIERVVLRALKGGADSQWDELLQRLSRVVVHKDRIEILKAAVSEEEEATIVVPVSLAHRNRARVLDDGTAGPDPTIVRALARAHEWRDWLQQGQVRSYRDIALKAAVDAGYVQTVLPLAFLDPQLTRELLDGRRQIHGGLMELLRRGIPARLAATAGVLRKPVGLSRSHFRDAEPQLVRPASRASRDRWPKSAEIAPHAAERPVSGLTGSRKSPETAALSESTPTAS